MDELKCSALKAELAGQKESQIVSIERFFDGNDDAASIGCNLTLHPGIDLFREVLMGLLQRADVQAVYAQIAESDPGEDSWPFADTVIVIGTISQHDLSKAVSVLQPTEVGSSRDYNSLARVHGGRALIVWWD